MSNSKFDSFSFNELIAIVKTIRATKSQSNQTRWKEGYRLESIDELEANVDDVLREITRRVQYVWNFNRITSNFKFSTTNLPMELLNVYNINPAEINLMIFTNGGLIGADIINGYEEIYLEFPNKGKFRMDQNGQILSL